MLVEIDDHLTVDEVTEVVGQERLAVYRSIQCLLQAGLIQEQQVNYEHGGYRHVYHPVDPDEAADDVQRMPNNWYAQVGVLIRELHDRYDEKITPAE